MMAGMGPHPPRPQTSEKAKPGLQRSPRRRVLTQKVLQEHRAGAGAALDGSQEQAGPGLGSEGQSARG